MTVSTHRSEADYIDRTIEVVRVHRSSENSWPQWANLLADEIEDLRGDIAQLTTERDQWQAHNTEAYERALAAEAEITRLRQEATVWQDEIREWMGRAAAAERDLERRDEALDAIEKELGTLPLDHLGPATERSVSKAWAMAREKRPAPELTPRAMTEDWQYTEEPVRDPHALCCRKCAEARESVANLQEGLRLMLEMDRRHAAWCGYNKNAPGDSIHRIAIGNARALLTDAGALDLTGIDLGAIIALAGTSEELSHWTHRMLQALDAYWLHYEGYSGKGQPLSPSTEEDWWIRFEKYRRRVEGLIA